MKSLLAVALTLIVLVISLTGAFAATHYVAQQAPNASDENPGTEEQPWKTLSHACATAQGGDTVWVKAGLYHETLEPKSDTVTFQAFGDEEVVIAPPTEVIDPTSWSKVTDRQYVYQCEADTEGKKLRVDGLALHFEQVKGVKTTFEVGWGKTEQVDREFEDTDVRYWTRLEEGVLQINLGGEDPAQHRVELAPANFNGIYLKTNNCRVKGFEVRDAGNAIDFDGERNIVEDCVVRGADIGAQFTGSANILRRCTLLQCWVGIFAGWPGTGAHVMEENFIIGTGHPVLSNQPPQAHLNKPWNQRVSICLREIHFCVVRHNVVADGAGWGWYPDANVYGTYFYGNMMLRIAGMAIYNEYPVNDSRIFYNAIVGSDSGIVYRFCWHTMTMYNYLANNRTGIAIWGPHVDRPYLLDNVIAKNLITGSQVYVSLEDNRGLQAGLPVGWPGEGEMSASGRYRLLSNKFSDNLYRGRPGDTFANFNGVKFSSLEEFQKVTGMEHGSRMDDNARMEDLALGLYTVRVPESLQPHEPAALIGNPVRQGVHTNPLPCAGEDAAYFWTQGDANALRVRGGPWWGVHERWPSVFGYSYEWPMFKKPVRRTIEIQNDAGADPSQPLKPGDPPQVWLECIGHLIDQIPAEGAGFWSPSLPTVPGASIQVSLQISGEELKPVAADGGPVILVWFQSLTGQHVQKVVLLGKQPDGQVMGEGPMEGTFPWRKIRAKVIAPQTAKRFSVFLGLKPAEGAVRYGDIYIKTLPGVSPSVPVAKPKRYEPISLAAHFNRDLDEDTGAPPGAPPPNKSLQQFCALPVLDLSGVKPGQYMAGRMAGKVPFEVTGRAIALRCFRRPPLTLPLEVNDIAVGRQVRTLQFLHAGPIQMGAQEYWRYLIHYEDGQTVEVIPVKSLEYLRYRQNYFAPQAPLQAAVMGDSCPDIGPMLRWVNLRPEVAVASVDFRSMDAGQAVLLAITAGY